MAVTTRYFGVTANGAGDGTTWANRAALFTGGAWSTVITAFNFTADSLKCVIGAGTHTITVAIAAASFSSTAPSAAFPLIFCGADSSGNLLSIPDPNWTSDLPAWDDSGLPVLNTTTNINTINNAFIVMRLIKLTSSGISGGSTPVNACAVADWCSIVNSSSNSSTFGFQATGKISNSLVSMTGSAYRAAIMFGTQPYGVHNVKLTGVTGSSGNRHGIEWTGGTTGYSLHQVCISGFGGDGIGTSASSTGSMHQLKNSVIANNAGNGVKLPSTASQTASYLIDGCMITGNGAYGIDAQSAARVYLTKTRLRDNTSGNLNGFGSWPTDIDVYTTDSDDGTEYVAAGSNNFQVKSGATIHGSGYGVSEQSSGSAGTKKRPGMYYNRNLPGVLH